VVVDVIEGQTGADVSDPNWFNPDPEKNLNADSDPRSKPCQNRIHRLEICVQLAY
jgi:hypothetical protein